MKEYLWDETHVLTEELERLQPLLSAAVIDGENNGYFIPHSYWSDWMGWLYIRWNLKETYKKIVVRYRFNDKAELESEVIKTNVSANEKLRGDDLNKPVVLITGDTHRDLSGDRKSRKVAASPF